MDKTKNKVGRPTKEIDKKKFENLCGLFCTKGEIAAFFDCSEDTIENFCKKTFKCTFSEAFKIYSSAGKVSLRRAQFKKALSGNVPLLIFLGKQYLGQKDNPDVDDLNESIKKLDEYLNGLPK